MLQLNKILFPTDFSACAESAFSHAAHLAAQYDAVLHVLHVHEWPYVDGESPMDYIQQGITQEVKLDVAQRMTALLTSVFWTSTQTPSDASTREISSTASDAMKKLDPAPP